MQQLSSEELSTKAAEIDSLLNTLMKARNFLSDPKRWYQGHLANRMTEFDNVTLDGAAISPSLSVCSIGAVLLFGGDTGVGRARSYLDRAAKQIGNSAHTVALNDNPSTTHPMILEMFDKAISLRAKDLGKS